MKTTVKLMLVILLASTLGLFSCRDEETELLEAPPGEVLKVDSKVADLMKRTAMNDGSFDNIIDNANCFSVKLPVTINVNGLEILVDSEKDFEVVEAIFEELEDDEDLLSFIFPITIVLSDFSEVNIENIDQLTSYSSQCEGENVDDDDIECLDFKYPIEVSLFNNLNELIETVELTSDKELLQLINRIDENVVANISFPITVEVADGTSVTINNLTQLENVIENAKDACDEDDDFDFDDDDCKDCTTDQLSTFVLNCESWQVAKLKREDKDLKERYASYFFLFQNDGVIRVVDADNDETLSGTWSASGSGNDIIMNIDIPDLPDFSDEWNLQEIVEDDGDFTLALRKGEDRLKFESDCKNTGSAIDLGTFLSSSDWKVERFLNDGTNNGSDYANYTIKFDANGTVTANKNGTVINGTWSASGSGRDTILTMNFESAPFDEFNAEWKTASFTTASKFLGLLENVDPQSRKTLVLEKE